MRILILSILLLNCAGLSWAQQPLPRKHALLIGINQYPTPTPPLYGALQDVARMEDILQRRFDFQDIETLKDQEATRANILDLLNNYRQHDARPGDIFLFYFSGYGSFVPDQDGDERDGFDEILCSYDFQKTTEHPLSDDFFRCFFQNWSDLQVIMIIDCSFALPGSHLPVPLQKRIRIKTVWPRNMPAIPPSRRDHHACLFVDQPLPTRHLFLGASRAYAPAFDATLHGKYITRNHGTFTCCLSANALTGITYKTLILRTIYICRKKFGQVPLLHCTRQILESKLFELQPSSPPARRQSH